jgi:hypothetical protein
LAQTEATKVRRHCHRRRANDDNCPADTPVSIIDRDTGQCVACHPTILDTERHRSLLQSDAILNADDDEDDPDDEPDDDDPGEDHPDVRTRTSTRAWTIRGTTSATTETGEARVRMANESLLPPIHL